MMMAPFCVRSTRFESAHGSNRWWRVHQRSSLLHYCLLVPIFEALITWGSYWNSSIPPVSAEVELVWLAVLSMASFILIFTFCSRSSFRMTVHTIQIMQLPCAVAFLCERIINTDFGGEIAIIVAVMLCSIFEIFTVPDFFATIVPVKRHYLADASHIEMAEFAYGESRRRYDEEEDDGEESDEGAALQSTDLAEKASNRSWNTLVSLLNNAEPARMTYEEMRNLIERCKAKLDRIAQCSEQNSGAATPIERRMISGGEYSPRTPSPRAPQPSKTGRRSSSINPLSLSGGLEAVAAAAIKGARNNAKRFGNKPEC